MFFKYLKPLLYLVIIVTVLIAIIPYFLIAMISLKDRLLLYSPKPVWIFKPTLQNYSSVFIEKEHYKYIVNSLIIALITTALTLGIGTPAAYAFSRFRVFAGHQLMLCILLTGMIPPIALALPLYLWFSKLHMIGTHLAVIICHTAFYLVYGVWIMKSFIDGIPKELDEAAMMDGCGTLSILVRIVFPVAAPGVVTSAIFIFIFSWNEFLGALVLSAEGSKTLPVTIPALVQHTGTLWGEVASLAVVSTLPVIIFTFFVQKRLIRGLTFGAIK